MKQKLTLLLLALVTSMGAWATVTQPTLTTDVNNPYYYTIKSCRSGNYASYAGPSTQLAQKATADCTSLWYFVANGEGVSIVPAADPSVKLATTTSATTAGAVWYLVENPYNAGYFCVSLKSDLSANCWDDQGSGTKIGYYNPRSTDFEGTSWTIEESNVTFDTRKTAIQNVINNLPSVLKPSAKTTALDNATTDAQLIAAVAAFSANVTFKCRSNNYLVVGSSQGAHVASPSNHEEIIQLVSVGDGSFYIKGYISMKYMGNVAMSAAIQTEATANTPYYVQAYGDYAVARPTKYADTGGSPNYEGYHYIHNGGAGCVGWEASNTNCQYTITEVDLPDGYVAVTYNVELDGNIVATETTRQASGNSAAVPSVLQRDYTTYSYDPAIIPANDATITATATVSGLPFTVSTDYANATWYYLRVHASYNDRYISTNGAATVFGQNKSATDAYKWAFIGNPVEGIKVINKASGDASYLMATSPATMGSTAKAWTLKKQTTTSWYSGANGFGLYDNSRTYLNPQDGTLKYWGSFDQGSTFWVQEIPEVTVTFNLEVNSVVVNTIEKNVPEGETVSVPTELWANYTSLGYTISGADDVTVGTTDQTVTVTATPKTGVVTSLAGLSNNKKYKITSARGSLSTYTDGGTVYLASPCKTALGIEGKDFAILNCDGKYYLYSVDDAKFVTYQSQAIAPLADNVTGISDAITFGETTSAVFTIKFNNDVNKFLNSSANYTYGIAINGWGDVSSEWDDGNQYVIVEVGDFDDYEFLTATYLTEEKQTNIVNAGKLGYMQNSGADFTALVNLIMTFNDANHVYTESDYNNLVTYYEACAANVKYPETGKYYLVKNNSTGKYMRVTAGNKAVEAVLADLTREEAMKNVSAHIYFTKDDGEHLYMRSQDQYFNQVYRNWVDYHAYVMASRDKYVNFANPAVGVIAFSIAFGNGSSEDYLNSGYYSLPYENGTIVYGSASNGAANPLAQWTFEEVSTLDITLNAVDGKSYATFCAPFDVTLGTGANAYKVELDEVNGKAVYSAITDNKVPAGAGVLIISDGAAASVEATINTTGTAFTALENNDLVGYYFSEAYTAEASSTKNLVLGVSSGSGIGFYQMNSTATASPNKAYLPYAYTANPVKGFVLVSDDDDATAIQTIDNGQQTTDASIFNLAGQRISKMQKGINIVNGKKILK